MSEPQGAYLAVLILLEGLADAGVIDGEGLSNIAGALAKRGKTLEDQGYAVEGGELLSIASNTQPIHARLRGIR